MTELYRTSLQQLRRMPGPGGRQVSQSVAGEVSRNVTAHSPSQLSNIALAFAKVLTQDAEVMSSLAVEASMTVSEFAPTDLANIA